jgi:hypothetical protein
MRGKPGRRQNKVQTETQFPDVASLIRATIRTYADFAALAPCAGK